MHFENGLLPKNPLYAERGEGCALSIIRWLSLFISPRLERAFPPHKINTVFFVLSEMSFITLSVNHAQPQLACEFARCSRTVSVVFKSNTPSFAHFVRSPQSGSFILRSLSISLYMFLSDGGRGTPRLYRKAQSVRLPRFVVGVLP